MSDEQLNIDTASRDELEKVATDLGVSFQGNTKDETLRKRIHETLGTTGEGHDPAPAGATQAAAPGEDKKAKRFRVIIQSNDQDKQPVQVFVNGKSYVIVRGEEVVVPASVVEVLRNAVQHHYDQKTMKESKVLAYPFSVMGEA